MLSLVMTISTICMADSNKVRAEEQEIDYGLNQPQIKKTVVTWDCIYFGNYLQSSDGKGGFIEEPIKWRVLSVKGNKALLLSDKNLDYKEYDKDEYGKEWVNSDERQWLNNQFLKDAFSENEQKAICDTFNHDKNSWINYFNGNYNNSCSWDKVFLLNDDEVYNKNIYQFLNNQVRKSSSTDYTYGKVKSNCWGLRSKMITKKSRSFIDGEGRLIKSGTIWSSSNMKLTERPAIQIDLSSIYWHYAGSVDSKGNVTEPTSIENPNDNQETTGDFISADDVENPIVEDGVSTWDCVYYGKYPQTLMSDGNFKKEPIKWRVLSKTNDDLFVMSDKVLDARYFNAEKVKIQWEYCDTRLWINKEFLSRAFSKEEQDSIKVTKVSTPNNPNNNRSGGLNTDDKIYLLSYQEIENSGYGFTEKYNVDSNARISYLTDYSYYKNSGEKTNVSNTKKAWWYLRSPGAANINIGIVGETGWSDYRGTNIHYHKDYIRPVMHLNPNNAKIKYAGTVSSDGKVTKEKYKALGECGENVKWKLNFETGTFKLYGSGNMYDYNSLDNGSDSPWNKYHTDIRKLVVDKEVKSIGDNAFRGCENLSEVELPAGITSIGDNSFNGCSSNAIFNVIKDSYAESYCQNKGFNYIAKYENIYGSCGTALDWEYNPNTLQLRIYGQGEMVDYIAETTGEGANHPWNSYRTKVKKIVIENGVTSIGRCAFRGLCGLEEIEIANTVNVVGIAAFQYCKSLGEVNVPEGVTMLNRSVFSWCLNLENVSLPNSLTSISDYAFEGCYDNLDSIVIPSKVNSIGSYAFWKCHNLRDIYLPDNISNISNNAFELCSNAKIFSVKNNSYAKKYCDNMGFNYVIR